MAVTKIPNPNPNSKFESVLSDVQNTLLTHQISLKKRGHAGNLLYFLFKMVFSTPAPY